MTSRWRFSILTHHMYMNLLVALAVTSVTLFASSAFGQSPATRPDSRQTEVAPEEPKPNRPENKVAAEEPRPTDLKSDVEAMKAENAAVRELLRKMEEQQKALLEQVDRLQRRLDGPATADVRPAAQPQGTPEADALIQATDAADTAGPPAPVPAKPVKDDDRYKDGIV